MRFLIDACGGYTVAEELRVQGHDVIFIGTTHPRLEDELILQRAIQERRIIITTDKDFEELVYKRGLSHYGILRLANVRIAPRLSLLREALAHHGSELGPGVIVIAQPGKIRVRRS